ncbi:MAG TPA: hypothetical protein VGX25_16270 [Actinophytocola sp.]|uniref:hypothetical protein n=1 Tax=Actinophytocola sp. TaxID=1872138 RepID=UPI002DDD7DE8|nr:hypothetical protein [Actinophytocola sp.]HEV2780940.1 hypothetical protein [Actinophytocola sp.]
MPKINEALTSQAQRRAGWFAARLPAVCRRCPATRPPAVRPGAFARVLAGRTRTYAYRFAHRTGPGPTPISGYV